MIVDQQTILTRAMARVPGPVTVVTTIDSSGQKWGFTANSFSSLSLDPPLVLVCLQKRASTHPAFICAHRFIVNVLSRDQEGVARRFATPGIDRFAAGDTEPCEFGLPGIPAAVVRVACTMHQVCNGGDHSILIGLVKAVHEDDALPLVYYNRSFSYPGPRMLAGRP